MVKVSVWTLVLVIIVGFYDLACAFNRRGQRSSKPYAVLGLIFIIGGIGGLIWVLLK